MIADEISILLRNLIKRGFVSKDPTEDNGTYDTMQVTYFGKTSIAEKVYPYGLQALPPKNTPACIWNVCGYEDNLAGIPYAQKERFKLLKKPGEVIVGSPKWQTYVYFKENGEIDIESKGKLSINVSGDVELKAENVKIDATKTDLGLGGKKIALNGDAVVDDKVVASGTNTSI